MQARFAAALRDPDLPVPVGLGSVSHRQAGTPLDRRFGIYRNNVRQSLIEALRSRFPASEGIVGPDFFAALAAEFIREHPPRSPLLMLYGDALPDFVDAFPPCRDLPYLGDVMRLEVARGRAYHAADAAPLAADHVAGMDAERLAGLRLALHPAATLLRSAHPVVTIWAMNSDVEPLRPIETWQGEDALVSRPALLVQVERLPPGGANFLSSLADGLPLAAAAEQAATRHPDFDLAANLAVMIRSGAFLAPDPQESHHGQPA